MYFPDREEFKRRLSSGARLVTVYREVLLDTESPISVYLKVCGNDKGYLLESVDGGEHVARYSFIGFDPFLEVESRDGISQVTHGDGQKDCLTGNPLHILRGLLNTYQVPAIKDLPRFSGGLVGYLAYDMVRFIEHLPDTPTDDLGLPDLWMMACRKMVVFDHVTRRSKIILNIPVDPDRPPVYDDAVREIDDLLKTLKANPVMANPDQGVSLRGKPEIRLNTSEKEFVASVEQAKEYIRSGDIFQVVLSQRAEAPLFVPPLSLYRVLRAVNPSPYMFYVNFGPTQLAGASPEMMVRLDDGVVENRPIAGTRRRGASGVDDVALEKDLLSDEKERAEHLMLVDLSRNDLGRVCQYGSITVPEFMGVERFSHVIHIVSQVKGLLRPGLDAIDAFEACFPAGTLSGAPKIRAMEIIDELEPRKRGPYGGSVGYFSFSGYMDTCITIRTALIHKGKVYIQAGAGIVMDSDPEREYRECMDKAQALFSALERAEEV